MVRMSETIQTGAMECKNKNRNFDLSPMYQKDM